MHSLVLATRVSAFWWLRDVGLPFVAIVGVPIKNSCNHSRVVKYHEQC